jgi:hypothetical protein
MERKVGVRQLKNETSRIVREVREERAEYVITVDGARREVGSDRTDRQRGGARGADPAFLREVDRLAVEVGKAWTSSLSAAEAVAEQRRQL